MVMHNRVGNAVQYSGWKKGSAALAPRFPERLVRIAFRRSSGWETLNATKSAMRSFPAEHRSMIMRVLALTVALAVAALTGTATSASADPWKDESGHGRWRYERSDGFRGRDHWRERRAYRYYGERPYRRAYREEYRYGPRRAYRDPYAGLPHPVYRRFPGDVPRSTPYPAFGYYRY
jgi:hypothetical protein